MAPTKADLAPAGNCGQAQRSPGPNPRGIVVFTRTKRRSAASEEKILPSINSDSAQSQPVVHIGFSLEGLLAAADDSGFVKAADPDITREDIKQFVVQLIAANNAALFVDFQFLTTRCDELAARVAELELITVVT